MSWEPARIAADSSSVDKQQDKERWSLETSVTGAVMVNKTMYSAFHFIPMIQYLWRHHYNNESRTNDNMEDFLYKCWCKYHHYKCSNDLPFFSIITELHIFGMAIPVSSIGSHFRMVVLWLSAFKNSCCSH